MIDFKKGMGREEGRNLGVIKITKTISMIILVVALMIILLGIVVFSGCRSRIEKMSSEASRTKEDLGEEKPQRKMALPGTLSDLSSPTDLVFAPDRTLYFLEKNGALRVVKEGNLIRKPLFTIKVPRLFGYNETGLLGIALSPNFTKDNFIFLYHTYRREGDLFNRVIRINAKRPGAKPKVILDGILGETIHNGGKLTFGPDGNLYIATGEADQTTLSQRKKSLNGKVLRIKPDGSIPEDNPFPNSAVYSLGHRNIFGMTFDDEGRLYITENGPDEKDEVNLIEPGKNYGWPKVLGFSNSRRFTNPLITYEKVNAPTGIVFYTGNLFPQLKDRLVFGDWVEGKIHALTLKGNRAEDEVVLSLNEGINALTIAPDGSLYAATQNKIVRITELE